MRDDFGDLQYLSAAGVVVVLVSVWTFLSGLLVTDFTWARMSA